MRRLPLIIVLTLSIAYAAYFSWFSISRHDKTNSTRFDLGNAEQVEWNLIHGRGFTETDPYGTATVSRFAFHSDPFLAVLAPFYAIWPRSETLLLLQVLTVASGGLAIFLIGRKLLSQWWGTILTFLFIINPALQWSLIFDVHAVTFVVPLILWAIWAALGKKYWLTLSCVVLAMMTKEEIGLSLPLIGLYVWWKQQQPRWGMALTFIPAVWSLVAFLVVLPHFQNGTAAGGEVYQSIFGSGVGQVLLGAIRHPATLVRHLTAPQNMKMMYQVLGPIGFLPLGSWWTFGAAPDYVINALSLKPAQHLIISHYSSGLTPWLFVGAIMALVRMIQRVDRVKLGHDRRTLYFVLTLWLVGWGGYGAWAFGPLPGAKNDHSRFVVWRNVYADPVGQWEERIPHHAAVSVTNNIGAHFSRREHFYSFPLGLDQADYVVVLEDHATPVVATQAEVTEKISSLRAGERWLVLEHTGELTVLKRKE